MKLLVIRPQPGADATAARIETAGHEADVLPLFAIQPIPWTPPAGNFEGLLLTSANAVRQAGVQLGHYAQLPVWAVGDRTASAALREGLTLAQVGTDGVEALLGQVEPQRLLWLSGEDRTFLPDAWASLVETVPVYRSAPLKPPEDWRIRVERCDHVLLHSERAAKYFASLAGEMKASISIAALSPKIAQAAGRGWQVVRVAAEPNDAALLSSLAPSPNIRSVASDTDDMKGLE
jgi:uroporphyrinogen-III synthase